MRISMKVGDFQCEASTDYQPLSILPSETRATVDAGIFIALKTELRQIATKLIEAKYAEGKEK